MNLEIWVGNNPDRFDFNTQCDGTVPTSIGRTASVACARTGQYVWFVQRFVSGRILTICEAEVFAKGVRNLPAPRYGHAMT